MNRCGCPRWEVEFLPNEDGVDEQTIGFPDLVHTHAEAPRKGINGVIRLHNVPRPAKRGTTYPRGWRETAVKGGRHIDLLTGIGRLGIQTVGFHQFRHRKASLPDQHVECFFLLDGVGDPSNGRCATRRYEGGWCGGWRGGRGGA